MIITKVHIRNFRALSDVNFDMSSFSCVIGENNAGKSSLMQAVKLFLKPTKLAESDFYDKTRPAIVSASLKVDGNDLKFIVDEEHRKRIAEVIQDGVLTFTQSFPPNERPQMTCTRRIPKEERWREETVAGLLKGKSGAALKQAVLEAYPEVKSGLEAIEGNPTQAKVKELIGAYVSSLGSDHWTCDDFAPLPVGLDASVKAFLPDPIYIEAVKDISADVKTTKEAVFGKLLGLLLNVIQSEAEMQTFRDTLTGLNAKLNVLTKPDGTRDDKRFKQVIALEDAIETNLREHFPDATIDLRIPPPDLQKILQSAEIDVHDGGVAGNVETKGDGLKRSVLFSLFRAFVQLSQPGSWAAGATLADIAHRHVILFEEPELYLHPKAQQVLFDSLAEVSKSFQVVVTTHSPLFFSARKTKSFAKLSKNRRENGIVPFSELISVDLEREISIKDEFQILCYENNNVAFFANTVLLVEGDSDVAVLKHLAFILNPAWDFDKGKVRVVKVGGKGNFSRYIDFFKRFRVDVRVLSDLDVLVSDFQKLGLRGDSPCFQTRSSLLQRVSNLVQQPEIERDDVKETWKERGARIIQIIASAKNGQKPTVDDLNFLTKVEDELGRNRAKVEALKSNESLQADKLSFLNQLRSEGIMIWARGAIEDYYPATVSGADKTAKAADFRQKITTREVALGLAADVPFGKDRTRNEFEAIFASVFDEIGTNEAGPVAIQSI